ncbi:pyrroline-5-carboxylate reductase [Archaeoglobales archaeon]|nr:MAG: pyrroline-5-carboxylate reductase [Archaeoglobales archaeon]
MRVAIIGYGNLGRAIAKALAKKHEIIATKRELNAKSKLKRIEVTTNNAYAVKNSECVILTVKPKDLMLVLDEIKDYVSNKLVISFVAFVKLHEIKSILKQAKVVRAMGNVGAEIGKSFTAYYVEYVDEETDKEIFNLLSLTGEVHKAKSEEELDLMTIFSGSAPAFIAKLIDAFIYAGLKCGLNAELSKKAALSVFNSTSELLRKESIDGLIKRITTPAGTTIEGLVTMEKHSVEFGIMDSIVKAVEKISKFKKG